VEQGVCISEWMTWGLASLAHRGTGGMYLRMDDMGARFARPPWNRGYGGCIPHSLRSPTVEQGVWGMYPPLASLAHRGTGGMGDTSPTPIFIFSKVI